jgi:hypothetical protein
MYESEITLFLKQLKQEKPHLEKSQMAGRALLWDKVLDEERLRENQQSRIAQSPYVYQTA